MECSSAGSSIHGSFQARILEWVAIPFSREKFPPRDQNLISCGSCTAGGFFIIWASCCNILYIWCQEATHWKRPSWWESSVQSLSHVRLFVIPWTASHQASLSTTNSWSLLKLMSIKSVMPSNYLIFCCPLLFLPSVFPCVRVFSSESVLCIMWSNYWSFSRLSVGT